MISPPGIALALDLPSAELKLPVLPGPVGDKVTGKTAAVLPASKSQVASPGIDGKISSHRRSCMNCRTRDIKEGG